MTYNLYNFSKKVLLESCKIRNINVSNKHTKQYIINELLNYYKKGGRIYKCRTKNNEMFVNSLTNPTNNKLFCTETLLTKNNKKIGCSLGPKQNMQCVPCNPGNKNKVPNNCRSCVQGNNVYYCK